MKTIHILKVDKPLQVGCLTEQGRIQKKLDAKCWEINGRKYVGKYLNPIGFYIEGKPVPNEHYAEVAFKRAKKPLAIGNIIEVRNNFESYDRPPGTPKRKKPFGYGCIYKITIRFTGLVYIGSTTNLKKRRKTHLRQLELGTHVNHKLRKAYNEHGRDKFRFKVINEFDSIGRYGLLEWEQHYIKTHKGKLMNIEKKPLDRAIRKLKSK